MKTNRMGFHLIEILITLAIITILAAIALPSYQNHLMRGRHLEAEVKLAKLAILMERYYIENNSYQNVSIALLNFPDVVAQGNYKLKIMNAGDNDYLLAATPLGRQAEKDSCGELLLYSNGDKKITGNSTVSECW